MGAAWLRRVSHISCVSSLGCWDSITPLMGLGRQNLGVPRRRLWLSLLPCFLTTCCTSCSYSEALPAFSDSSLLYVKPGLGHFPLHTAKNNSQGLCMEERLLTAKWSCHAGQTAEVYRAQWLQELEEINSGVDFHSSLATAFRVEFLNFLAI